MNTESSFTDTHIGFVALSGMVAQLVTGNIVAAVAMTAIPKTIPWNRSPPSEVNLRISSSAFWGIKPRR